MNKIPQSVLEAFPALAKATFVRRMASPVPLVPDTIFDIYTTNSNDFLTLVSTDYADPKHQSQELRSISGQYGFEFDNILKPHDPGKTIQITEHDGMDATFFIKKNATYYYLANTMIHRPH